MIHTIRVNGCPHPPPRRLHQTPLHRQLRAAGVSRLLVAGVAAEHCVLWTVRDAVRLGYQVSSSRWGVGGGVGWEGGWVRMGRGRRGDAGSS